MRWLLLDLVLVLLGLIALALVGLWLYRAVRALLRRAGRASDQVGEVLQALDAAQAPPPARPR